jgi:hypothetical protein
VAAGRGHLLVFKDGDFITVGGCAVVGEEDGVLMAGEQGAGGADQGCASGGGGYIDGGGAVGGQRAVRGNAALADVAGEQGAFDFTLTAGAM